MQRTYQAILRFYPRGHRAIFGHEMLDNLNRTTAACRSRGRFATLRCWCREAAGLVSGAVSEWMTKWNAGSGYLRTVSVSEDVAKLPPAIADAKKQLQRTLGLMEHAIAHHDFAKARLYSDQERLTRKHLNQLLTSHRTGQSNPC